MKDFVRSPERWNEKEGASDTVTEATSQTNSPHPPPPPLFLILPSLLLHLLFASIEKVHSVMESTSSSIDNFVETQRSLNDAMSPFVTVFSVREGGMVGVKESEQASEQA